MSRLFLHIGSHKTGTTSLQQALATRLSKGGSFRFLDLRQPGTKLVRTSGKGPTFRATINLEKCDRVFKEALSDRSDPSTDWVCSDEDFFWLSSPDDVLGFADVLRRYFSEVHVICYVRRQDQLALAHRKQVVEGHAAARFYRYRLSPMPIFRPFYMEYFDYLRKLGQVWAPAVGRDRIRVRVFDRSRMVGGDILEDFAEVTGVRFQPGTSVESNASLAGNQIYLGLVLLQAGVKRLARRRIVRALPGEGRYDPSRDGAQSFLDHFRSANDRLSSEWALDGDGAVFDQSLQMYPEEQGDATWDYSSVRRKLAKVLDKEALANLGL